jgi:voltage-gated potassium channel
MQKIILFLVGNLRAIFLVYFLSLFLCAGIISVVEEMSYGDALWYSNVTSLTIGYGDIAAKTAAGRIVIMLFAHFWVFGIAPLIVVNILDRVIKDRNEFTHEEQEELKAMLRRIIELEEKQCQ